jgi:arginyl-tRNA synthetase (EC 6.1.1.19)
VVEPPCVFRQFRAAVADALADASAAAGYPTEELGIEEPPEDVDATLASSVAFRLAAEAGAPPPQVAGELAAEIDPSEVAYLGRVETQGPYVNFYTDDSYLTETLAAADDDWGRLPDRGESVVVEHTSANPTGPVHVGRARNPIVGDAVANALDYAGYDVARHYYVNDAGRQVAVFTWAYETFEEAELPAPEREKSDYELVRYYRAGQRLPRRGRRRAPLDGRRTGGRRGRNRVTHARVGGPPGRCRRRLRPGGRGGRQRPRGDA